MGQYSRRPAKARERSEKTLEGKTYALGDLRVLGKTLNLLDVFVGQRFEGDLVVSRGDVIRFDDRREDRQIVLNVQGDVVGVAVDTEHFLQKRERIGERGEERGRRTISSPGRQVSQRSPSKRISFERGIRPGGTVPGLS